MVSFDDNSESPSHEIKLAYTLFVLKVFAYGLFTFLNAGQVYLEYKYYKIKTKHLINVKFFIFICFTLFCASRVIYGSLFLAYPRKWQVGTIFYFFFSWGVYLVFAGWSFLTALWLQLLYQFFTSKEIRTKSIKKIYLVNFLAIGIYFCWQLPISIIFLINDSIAILEAIGMLAFIIVLAIIIIVNGSILVKRMKESSKANGFQYDSMIKKSKILITTAIICIIVVLAQDIVINFFEPRDPEPYRDMIISNLLTGLVDFIQMLIVMFILGNNSFKHYFLFRKIERIKSSDSDFSTNDQSKGKSNSNGSRLSMPFENNSKNNKLSNSRVELTIGISKDSNNDNNNSNSYENNNNNSNNNNDNV